MRKKRHNYSSEEKVAILKKHLVEQIPVSDLCDQYQLQPTIFYQWQKQFFENGAAAESFIKTLKAEEVYLWEYRTFDDVLKRVPYFIEAVYNQKRLHSSLGYRPPNEFETLLEGGIRISTSSGKSILGQM